MNNNTVVIKLDKARTIKLSNKVLKKLEIIFECSIMDLVSKIQSLLIEDLMVIIYEGLIHEDAELTPEKLEELLDEHYSYVGLIKIVTEAFVSSLGKQEEMGKIPPNARRMGKK